LADFYLDLHERRSDIKKEIREGSGERDKLEEVLSVLEHILEIKSSLGTWKDEVEAAIRDGRMPDWSKGATD